MTMPKKLYHVTLTQEEQDSLQTIVKKGKDSARKITRARILMLASQGKKDDDIVESLQVGRATIE